MAEYLIQDTTLTGIADAIRGKTGETGTIPVPDMASKIDGIQTGGGSAGGVSPKAVNFYDYDGTVLHAYTKEEFLALTELPPLPEREGLICQEWNWSFEAMRDYTSTNGACNAGATYITDDGTTRIYITLQEGRTSPMLGLAVKGTVTVDWGDGTTPDVLTGTSTSTVKRTPNHEYATPGDYVIRLTVDGTVALKYSSSGSGLLTAVSTDSDKVNYAYRNAIDKIEFGAGVTALDNYSLCKCYSLASVVIPNVVTSIGSDTFNGCYSLVSVVMPNGVTSIKYATFIDCYSLVSVVMPNGVTSIVDQAFSNCHSLASVVISNGTTSIGSNAFYNCYSLASVVIPNGTTSISPSAFYNCYSLASVVIPNGVTSIMAAAFSNCYSVAVVVISNGTTSIGSNVFKNCYSVAVYDFTSCTTAPTLEYTDAFSNIPADCQIRVPAALYDEWIAATNWSTYASKIVAV
jgi:hypothetical protein